MLVVLREECFRWFRVETAILGLTDIARHAEQIINQMISVLCQPYRASSLIMRQLAATS